MKTDSEFKILFKKHAAELLALTGDRGARVLNVDSVEVRELRRAVDCVMKLEQEGQVYIEFESLSLAGNSGPGQKAASAGHTPARGVGSIQCL